MKSKQKILIYSARGMGNVGDDLVAEMAKQIFSGLYRRTSIRFGTIPFKKEDVDWADIVGLGGGGIIYDHEDNIKNYTDPLEYAVKLGKKTFVQSVGVQGDLVSEYAQKRYAEVLKSVDFVSTRHKIGAEKLSRIGVENVHTSTDLGLFAGNLYHGTPSKLGRSGKKLQAIKKQHGSRIVGVSVASEVWREELMRDMSIEERDWRLRANRHHFDVIHKIADRDTVVLLVHSLDDLEMYEKIAQGHDNIHIINLSAEHASSKELYEVYSQVDVLMASRYHAFIMGLLTGTSMVVYDGKIGDMIRENLPEYSDKIYRLDDAMKDDTIRQMYISLSPVSFSVTEKSRAALVSKLNDMNSIMQTVLR